MVRALCSVALLIGSCSAFAQAQPSVQAVVTAFPSDSAIRKILDDRLDTLTGQQGGVGIVVGLIDAGQRRVISSGHLDTGDTRLVNGATCFEIGSITKLFTALLLSDMVQRKEVSLADPVSRHLPAGVNVPEPNGREITLLDLATHTSGLPFMPDETTQGVGAQALYDFLRRYRASPAKADRWDYSNVGYWLLGEALAFRAGMPYDRLLAERVAGPLRLTKTGLIVSPTMKANLATGHDTALRRAAFISEMPLYRNMSAAGGLLSTADDLLRLLAVTMASEPSPLAPAAAAMLETRRPMQRADQMQALGWVVTRQGGDEVFAHDGGTLGYSGAVVWSAKRPAGVVVLSNHVSSVADIARHLLDPSVPLAAPARPPQEITIESRLLDAYAGRYEATAEGAFVVTRAPDFLTITLPAAWGLPTLRLRPASTREFFTAELPLRVTFEADAAGHVTSMLVQPPRGQKTIRAARMSR